MEQLTVLEERFQLWSVPNDVREAVRRAVGVVAGAGASPHQAVGAHPSEDAENVSHCCASPLR